MEKFNVSWVDLVTAVLLLMGVIRGRARGMSEELLDVVKWLLIVVVGGYSYEPLGLMLAQSSVFSPLACFVAVYATSALILHMVFSAIRRRMGEKVVSSDTFGNGEYYLGMMAGAFRYLCILLVLLAFLHAPQYSAEEIKASAKYQESNFGSTFFPTVSGVQSEVFQNSFTGTLAKNYLPMLLIHSTPSTKSELQSGGMVRARERAVYEVLDKK